MKTINQLLKNITNKGYNKTLTISLDPKQYTHQLYTDEHMEIWGMPENISQKR